MAGLPSLSDCNPGSIGVSQPNCLERVDAPVIANIGSMIPSTPNTYGADRVFQNPEQTFSASWGYNGSSSCTFTGPYIYEDPSGGMHSMNLTSVIRWTGQGCPLFNIGDALYDNDGHYRAVGTPGVGGISVVDSHGDVGYGFGLQGVNDTNGNLRNGTGRPWSMTTTQVNPNTTQAATVPLSITIPGLSAPYTFQYQTVTASGGSLNGWLDTSVSSSGCYYDNGPLVVTGGFTGTKSITLPNGQLYGFGYDSKWGLINSITYPTGATVKYTFGVNQLSEPFFSFPSPPINAMSGRVQYCYYRQDLPVVNSRVVSYDGVNPAVEQDYSYSMTWGTSGVWATKQTKVTTKDLARPGSPISGITVYNYLPFQVGAPPGSNTPSYVPIEDTVVYEDNVGKTLHTTKKIWLDQNLLAAECEILPTGQVSGKFYQYQYVTNWGYTDEPTDIAEYDYGQVASTCAQPGSSIVPARETKVQYASFGASPYWSAGTTYTVYWQQNPETIPPDPLISDRPSSIQAYDHGSLIAETDYSYDQTAVSSVTPAPIIGHDTNYSASSTIPRGNLTSIRRKCLQSCADAVTTATYDETGQVTSIVDPNGNASGATPANHKTYLYYADAYTTDDGSAPNGGNTNTYLTKIVRPSTNGITHQQSFVYDYGKGELRSVTDENSQTATYRYDDVWGRPTDAKFPDGGEISTAYSDAGPNPTVTTTSYLNSSDPPKVTELIKDAYGHIIHTETVSADEGAEAVDTTYDGEGMVYLQSNPHLASASVADWTTFYHDALGRPTFEVHPDNSVLKWCYDDIAPALPLSPSGVTNNCSTQIGVGPKGTPTGTWTDSSDERGNHWQRSSDTFGNLAWVVEPNGTTQTPSMETDYTYDGQRNLLSVKQKGNGTTDTPVNRSFVYDSLSRLKTSTNPETGTISYAYDPNGNPLSKTDARNVTIAYSYDALNRLLGKSYSSGGSALSDPSVCMQYDTPVNPSTDQYAKGHLTVEWTVPSGTCPAANQTISALPASTYTATAIMAHDQMGRVTQEQQCTPANCSGTRFAPAFTYDWIGDVTTSMNGVSSQDIHNPSVQFTYKYDGAARLKTVTSTWEGDSNHPSKLFDATGGYGPMGLTNASYAFNDSDGKARLTLTRTYDNRSRITSDTYVNVIHDATIANSALAILGSEQSKGTPTPATGTVIMGAASGGEQSKVTVAAASSTGTVSIGGSEQSLPISATQATATISISGTEQSTTITYQCGPSPSNQCSQTIWDAGSINVYINGTLVSGGFFQGSTSSAVASTLASNVNANSGLPVGATVSGATVILTAKTPGAAGNAITLSVTVADSAPSNFPTPSFSVATSGGTLANGTNAATLYDSGIASATINGCTGSYNWGQSDSTSSIATGLAQGIGTTCSASFTASASGAVVSVTSKATGSATNWPMATAMSHNTAKFSSASYTISGSGMNGGRDQVTVYDSGTLSVTINGTQTSISYGQGDTQNAVTLRLLSALQPSTLVTSVITGSNISLTTKQPGAGANYSFAATQTYDTTHFSAPSFTATSSGGTLTGGTDTSGNPIYDSGTVTLTIGGTAKSVSYGSGATTSSIASQLATAFNGNSLVSVSASGSTLSAVAKSAGSAGNYSCTVGVTYDSAHFSSASFAGSPATCTLSGGTNASNTPATVYSYSMPAGGYDTNSNLLKVNDSVMGQWTYSYDTLNRLSTGLASSGSYNGQYGCWTYDDFGNRTMDAISAKACNASPTPTFWAHFSAANQFTGTSLKTTMSVGNGYDVAGNITDDGAYQYLYDAEGRVCAVKNPTTGTLTQYIYDADGQRVAKGSSTFFTCNQTNNGFVPTNSYVLGPGGEQLTEFDGAGHWIHSNVYESGELLTTYSGSTTYFSLNDWLGTKRAEATPDGGAVATFSSLPYGDGFSRSGSGSDATENHYTGKERDSESGNDYFGARYYASSMGRFMTPDSASNPQAVPYASYANPQTLNLYSYVRNNPLNDGDADGHCDLFCASSIVWGIFQGIQRDGGVRPYLKNVGTGILKGAGSAVVNTTKLAAVAANPATAASLLTPGPKALRPSNATQAQASIATQVILPAAAGVAAGALIGAAGETSGAAEGGSAAAADLFVIGRQADTAAYLGQPGFSVLDVPNWSQAVNEAWVQSGIDSGSNFLLASPTDGANLFSEEYGQTEFATELDQLNNASYTHVEDQMVAPGSADVKP